MDRVGTLIVGGGVAGAALAYHLATAPPAGGRPVRLLERAPLPGRHASGRNARLVLQSVADPLIRSLTAASVEAFAAHAGDVGYLATGSLLLGSEADLTERRDPDVESHLVGTDAVRAKAPLVGEDLPEAALFTPDDGVLDPHRLLAFYLDGARRAGAEVSLGVEVQSIDGDGPFRVVTSAGTCLAERLVDAAGAWANELAVRVGAAPLPLVPYKRHLFLHPTLLPLELPHVWLLEPEVYFRPDAEGALSCMCDEEPSETLDETVTAGVDTLLRERLHLLAPRLAVAPITRSWSCFRTRSRDGRPVIGPDPRLPDFWWLGGLGGFGLGSSWEVGRLAARAMLAGAEGVETLPREVLPSRFA